MGISGSSTSHSRYRVRHHRHRMRLSTREFGLSLNVLTVPFGPIMRLTWGQSGNRCFGVPSPPANMRVNHNSESLRGYSSSTSTTLAPAAYADSMTAFMYAPSTESELAARLCGLKPFRTRSASATVIVS